jgi:hypothetical protein
MMELNFMEEEFHAHRTIERRHTANFAIQCEMDHEEYKEKREAERAWKHEKERCVKEAYERGDEKALM